jgi:hypothetical protein
MVTDYLLLGLSILFIVIGIAGCLVPVLPGPPLSFVGLLLVHLTDFADVSKNLLIILGAIALLVSIFDYVVPIWGTKKFGGSKHGTRGAMIGLIFGLFFGPPGLIIGPFLGAVIGEMMFKNDFKYALKAGFGSLIGFLMGVGLKLAVSFTITFYFVKAIITT